MLKVTIDNSYVRSIAEVKVGQALVHFQQRNYVYLRISESTFLGIGEHPLDGKIPTYTPEQMASGFKSYEIVEITDIKAKVVGL